MENENAETKELMTFIYGESDIRTVNLNNEPWFVGKDVAEVLGYSNPQKAIRDHIDENDRTVNDSFTVNGTTPILINESGLYSLILGSKLESAKRFKKWVTSEVLPQIRKTGRYEGEAQELRSEIAELKKSNLELTQAMTKIAENLSETKKRASYTMPDWKLDDARNFAEDCLEFVEDSSEGAECKVWEVYWTYKKWKNNTRPWSTIMSQSDLTRALKTLYGINEKQKRFQGDGGNPQLIFLDVRLKQSFQTATADDENTAQKEV